MRKLLVLLFLVGCVPGAKYTLHEDNDYFVPTKNNDRDFTQALQLNAEYPDKTGSTAYYFGNLVYTPGNKQLTTYQPNERPYAGYTYIGSDFKYRTTPDTQNVYGIEAGIVGPQSYSEEVQNTVHNFLGQKTAKGWDNQIHNELGIILKAEHDYAYTFNPNLDSVTTIGGHLGNVFTQGFTGVLVRYGHNLPDSFSTGDVIYPRLPRQDEKKQWSYYLFGGPWARLVFANIFLDGNTFRDSPSIDKYPFVAEGRLGFGLIYSNYKLEYTYIAHTHEYHGDGESPDFGEVNLSLIW